MNPASPKPPLESSVWESSSGVAAHRSSAVGGGGPGAFTQNLPLGGDGNNADPIIHPQSPAIRQSGFEAEDIKKLRTAGLDVEDATPLQTGAPTKDPPTTNKITFTMTRKNAKEDIDVKVNVEADGSLTGAGQEWSAKTVCDPSKLVIKTPQWKVSKVNPALTDENQVVDGIEGKLTITGTVKLQIRYGTNAKPTSPAAWGRGTTKADVTAGDTTVGFHESKHLEDFTTYLQKTALPTFSGATGQTVKKFEAAQEEWDTITDTNGTVTQESLLDKYFGKMESDSRTKTDETTDGVKLSDYVKTHPGTNH